MKPFKFRHLNEIVGTFIIGSALLVLTSGVLVAYARKWLQGHETFVARSQPFAETQLSELDELRFLLRPGTTVEIEGRPAGQVLRSSIDEQRSLLLFLEVPKAQAGRLHSDGRAVLRLPIAGTFGDTAVVIKPGRSEIALPSEKAGGIMKLEVPGDPMRLVTAIMSDLQQNLGPLLKNVNAAVTEARGILAQVEREQLPAKAAAVIAEAQKAAATINRDGRIDQLLARVEAITGEAHALIAGLNRGEGTLGRLLKDDALLKQVQGLLTQVHGLLGQVQESLAQVQRNLPLVPGLLRDVDATLGSSRTLLDGLNRHWLLSAYTQPPEPRPIAPAGVLALPPDLPSPRPAAGATGAAP